VSSGEAVDGIVLAAGRGERLGLGAKAWLDLGGRTLLERAVAAIAAAADRVVVGVTAEDVPRARSLCGPEVLVVAGGATHRETMLAAFRAGRAPWILIHDVVHPFVTPALARQVVQAARAHGAAVAAVRSDSSAYRRVDGALAERLGPGDLWLVRRPFAARRADFARAVTTGATGEGLAVLLGHIGVSIEIVPAPPWNLKVTTAEDWALAQAIDAGLAPV
jgi:2-C-methyl-D-erythritol 4-phosphate cytidylyltransferase